MTTTRSYLAQLLDGWTANGWPTEQLHRFRMEEGDAGEGDAGSGEGGDDGSGAAGGQDDKSDAGDAGDGGDAGDKAKSGDDDKVDWKALARKHEDRSKKATAELEKLKKAQMSESEQALTEAEERGRKAATAEAGQKLAAAEIKAALAGVVPDPKLIVEDLNLAKYVNDDGDVDDEAVKVLKEKYVALAKPGKARGDGDGGSRGGDKPKRAGSITEAVNKKLGVGA